MNPHVGVEKYFPLRLREILHLKFQELSRDEKTFNQG